MHLVQYWTYLWCLQQMSHKLGGMPLSRSLLVHDYYMLGVLHFSLYPVFNRTSDKGLGPIRRVWIKRWRQIIHKSKSTIYEVLSNSTPLQSNSLKYIVQKIWSIGVNQRSFKYRLIVMDIFRHSLITPIIGNIYIYARCPRINLWLSVEKR